jgi:hypothetical protein
MLNDYGLRYWGPDDGLWQRTGAAKPERRRRERKLTFAGALKQASKAGVDIVRYEVEPDGKVVIVTGKPEPKSETDRELEEFNARHG